MDITLSDILGALRFGPENTMQADPMTTSIYTTEEEWQAYRDKQEEQRKAAMGTPASIGVAAGDPYYTQQVFAPDAVKLESLAQHAVNGPRGLSPDEVAALLPGKTTEQATPKHAKEDSINADFNPAGIKAFTDEKGQLVLTNKPDAKNAKEAMALWTPEQTAAVKTSNPAMSNNVAGLLDTLRKSADYASASGTAVALNEALELETARIQRDAIKFAEQSVGIPQLQASLARSEAIDAQVKDQWGRPAMGDSPATKNLRSRLAQAGAMVNRKAEQWLSQNSQYASLKSASTNAKLLLEEKQRMFTQVEAKRLRDQDKQEQKDAIALDRLEVMPPHTTDRLSKLNPTLNRTTDPVTGEAVDPRVQAARYFSLRVNDKAFVEAVVNTSDEDLPALAVRGNQYARQLAIAKEMGATGMSAEHVSSLMDQLSKMATDPGLQDLYVEKTTPKNAPDRKEQISAKRMELNKSKLDAEGKSNEARINSNIAIQLYRMGATQRFTDDVSSWNSANPDIQAAIKKAAETTGRADIRNVWTALVGDATGEQAIARTKLLAAEASAASNKYKGSLFGTPNDMEIQALLTYMVKTRTSWWAALQGEMAPTYRHIQSLVPFIGEQLASR